MLSKPATMLLGLINEKPSNAYELIKQLKVMRVKGWYEIADSTVYATIKALEKKSYIIGKVQKNGNMPDKTVYTLTEMGNTELRSTLKSYIEKFNYDFVPYMISVFFINIFDKQEIISLLSIRLEYVNKTSAEIEKQIAKLKSLNLPGYIVTNVQHNALLIQAEATAVSELISAIQSEQGLL